MWGVRYFAKQEMFLKTWDDEQMPGSTEITDIGHGENEPHQLATKMMIFFRFGIMHMQLFKSSCADNEQVCTGDKLARMDPLSMSNKV